MVPVESPLWMPALAGDLLEDDTVEIWRASVQLNSVANHITGLKSKERVCAEHMHSPSRRAQYAAGHILLAQLREKYGAPLFTSLSHSGDWVVAAAARTGPVGVDVESLRTDRPLERLAHRFFPPEESVWLERLTSEEQVGNFYRLWTAKEALFKALGMPEGEVHFAARPVLESSQRFPLSPELIVEKCRVGWFSAAYGYLGAYAAPETVSHVNYLTQT